MKRKCLANFVIAVFSILIFQILLANNSAKAQTINWTSPANDQMTLNFPGKYFKDNDMTHVQTLLWEGTPVKMFTSDVLRNLDPTGSINDSGLLHAEEFGPLNARLYVSGNTFDWSGNHALSFSKNISKPLTSIYTCYISDDIAFHLLGITMPIIVYPNPIVEQPSDKRIYENGKFIMSKPIKDPYLDIPYLPEDYSDLEGYVKELPGDGGEFYNDAKEVLDLGDNNKVGVPVGNYNVTYWEELNHPALPEGLKVTPGAQNQAKEKWRVMPTPVIENDLKDEINLKLGSKIDLTSKVIDEGNPDAKPELVIKDQEGNIVKKQSRQDQEQEDYSFEAETPGNYTASLIYHYKDQFNNSYPDIVKQHIIRVTEAENEIKPEPEQPENPNQPNESGQTGEELEKENETGKLGNNKKQKSQNILKEVKENKENQAKTQSGSKKSLNLAIDHNKKLLPSVGETILVYISSLFGLVIVLIAFMLLRKNRRRRE